MTSITKPMSGASIIRSLLFLRCLIKSRKKEFYHVCKTKLRNKFLPGLL